MLWMKVLSHTSQCSIGVKGTSRAASPYLVAQAEGAHRPRLRVSQLSFLKGGPSDAGRQLHALFRRPSTGPYHTVSQGRPPSVSAPCRSVSSAERLSTSAFGIALS